MNSRHSLLARQLRKCLGDYSDPDGFSRFVDAVDAAYTAFDADRSMLERSLELSSQELLKAYSDQKQMTEALRVSEEEKALLLNSSVDLIAYHDRDMRVLWANEKAVAAAKLSLEKLKGRHCWEFWQGRTEPCDGCPVVKAQATGQPEIAEVMTADAKVWFIRAYPVKDSGGNLLGVAEFSLDITERKQLEDALRRAHSELEQRVQERTAELMTANALLTKEIAERKRAEAEKSAFQEQFFQAQKMEAVGQLAGGLAHDFNNLLSSIICNCYLLQKYVPEQSDLRSFVDEIRASSLKGSQLITSLLAFSKKQPLVTRAVNINHILRDAHSLLSRVLGEDIALETVLADEELMVLADNVRLEQVLMNLATNARDAMPQGGSLTITTRRAEIDDLFVAAHGTGSCGSYVCITVADTGAGMDEQTRERIFEPFFTTKEVGKGTGLGLSMVYGTINQHNGFITTESAPHAGTIFSLFLPLIPVAADQAELPGTAPVAEGCETLLLVEDEQAVRSSMKAVLESFGYRVVEAVDGTDAIEKMKDHVSEIEGLVTDIIMPRKNGWELYQEACAIIPGIRPVFTSGYLDNTAHAREIAASGFRILTKPVDPMELHRAVRIMLEQQKS